MAKAAAKGSKGIVLCVDDDPDVLATISLVLRDNGYDTVLARDGEEGLAVFRKRKSVLVAAILDLRMPRKDGLELARDIRRESPGIPLIALSAYLTPGKADSISVKQCEEAGFTAYTIKPFSLEPFLATIDDCVQQGKAERR